MKRNIHIGDVIEIRTTKGLAYAQYTHKHKQYGALLRVFNRIYLEQPTDLKSLIIEEEAFQCFFPLSAALNLKLVRVVTNISVPEKNKKFPTFRAGIVDPATKKVAVWWLWDGEKEWRIGELDKEQKKLPIRGIWNDTLLIERIDSGWTPETDLT
jgi:hypothetical protein